MMIDRTEEDIGQDAKIADLAKRLQEQNQRLEHVAELIGNLQKILEPVMLLKQHVDAIDATVGRALQLASKVEPLEKVVDELHAAVVRIRSHIVL